MMIGDPGTGKSMPQITTELHQINWKHPIHLMMMMKTSQELYCSAKAVTESKSQKGSRFSEKEHKMLTLIRKENIPAGVGPAEWRYSDPFFGCFY